MSKHSSSPLLSGVVLTLLAALAAGVASADTRMARAGGVPQYSDRIAPSAGVALALPSDRAAVTSARVQGRWEAQAEDGSMTVLDLRPSGGFSFDHAAQATPERAYMCGNWSLEGGSLSLRAKTTKTRLASGEIQVADAEQKQSYTVLAARGDVLVLRTDDHETLTFYRRGA